EVQARIQPRRPGPKCIGSPTGSVTRSSAVLEGSIAPETLMVGRQFLCLSRAIALPSVRISTFSAARAVEANEDPAGILRYSIKKLIHSHESCMQRFTLSIPAGFLRIAI